MEVMQLHYLSTTDYLTDTELLSNSPKRAITIYKGVVELQNHEYARIH